MYDDWLTDPTVVAPFDPAVQDALQGVEDITHMVDDIVADAEAEATAPSDVTSSWAPPLDFLPDPTAPAPFIPDLIHPDEFALNGFPYWGTDPTEPGYWNPPSL